MSDYRAKATCPNCGKKDCLIEIEPFYGTYYWCSICKKSFGFKGID